MASRLPKLPTRVRNYAVKPADARRKDGAVALRMMRLWRRHTSEPYAWSVFAPFILLNI